MKLYFIFTFAGSSKMDSPILSHDSRHKPGESRTSSRPGRPAVGGTYRHPCLLSPVFICLPALNECTQTRDHWFTDMGIEILFPHSCTLSVPNLYLFTSKMQSYKRAIGEVSVTVANAHYSCMSVSVSSLRTCLFISKSCEM